MKPVIYAGTFNPIHQAHLIIAQTVKDELGSNKVVFIPSYIPPHRENHLAPPEHRLNMVKLATKDNSDFEVSDIEFKSEETSYTYLTLKKLHQEMNINEKFDFIIGTDAFEKIDSWFKPEEIAKMVRFIVIVREENFDKKAFFDKIKLKDFEYKIAKVPYLEISSSLIRNRIQEDKSIKYLVAKEVEEYIKEHKVF